MNKKLSQIITVLLLMLIVQSCSRKKDKWVNRNWHSMTTKNNTLYNGRVAFDKGQEDIVQTYKDNFWELLPVERLIVSEDVRLPNEVLNQNFDKAEEKAAKAIQKHSMLIDNRERNPKIDESFLLLGKARYNEQRFIPALQAFNYILYKYPTSNNINHAKVWKAKTNLRLDNNEKAIEDLMRMIEQEYMKPQDYSDAVAMISQAYINLEQKDSAVTYISKAAIHSQNDEKKGRYLYIKGQLLNQLGYKDSANYAFDQVIELNRKTPRRYMLNAYMAKARNFDYEKENKEEFLELLTDLEENRENRPFLDKIYNQKAVYFNTLDSIELAVKYYNQSLRTNSEDTQLQSYNYKALGDISFDDKKYATSGAYYDSTLQRMVVDSKKYRVLKKKRENLDDVILYEGVAQTNDSILRVVAMSPEERVAYYSEYTEKIKAVAIAEAEAAEIARIKGELPTEQRFNQARTSLGNAVVKGPSEEKGIFYFYNPTTVTYGKTAFKRKFGNRELADNWRISSINDPSAISSEEQEEQEEYSIDADPLYDPQTYIAELPTDQAVIDSLQTDRNFAYYQLGVIYKEKFIEYDLAIDKFTNLLQSNPEERLIIPSKYNLYKIYEAREEQAKLNEIKQDIIRNHGDSRYAKILQNPNEVLKDDKNSPGSIYNKLYQDFKNQKYASVIKESDEMITKFTGEDFVPKFELLKAQAIGRFQGFDTYKKALNYVALNYPQSPEGKKAQLMYQTAIPQIENNSFLEGNDQQKHHKLMYAFSTYDPQAIELKELLEVIIKELKYHKMTVSLDVYTKDQQFVVIHTKRDKLGAEGLAELLTLGKIEDTEGVDLTNWNRKKKYHPKVDKEFIIVASPNYRVIQIHKNLEAYVQQNVEDNSEQDTEKPPVEKIE